MRHLTCYTKLKNKCNLAPLTAFLLCFFFISSANCGIAERVGFAGGLVSTSWHRLASFGVLIQHSDHHATYTSLDLGGGLSAGKAQEILIFRLGKRTSLGFMLGTEVAITQPDPSIDDKLTYLNGSIGTIFNIQISKDIGAWCSATYIETGSDIQTYRLGIGLIVWVPKE